MIKKKSVLNIIAVLLFTAAVTISALYFQWAEFYKGYSLSDFNLKISIDFLALWFAFSFYWGFKNNRKYKKYIIIYSLLCIIMILINCLFYRFNIVEKLIYPFQIWFAGPLYGFVCIFNAIAMTLGISVIKMTIMLLIISPLLLIACYGGYSLGTCLNKKLKSRNINK